MTYRERIVGAAIVAVALTVGWLAYAPFFQTHLTQDEITRFGATRAFDRMYCGTRAEWSDKAVEIATRARNLAESQPGLREAITQATERFRDTHCRDLLKQFSDMLEPWQD